MICMWLDVKREASVTGAHLIPKLMIGPSLVIYYEVGLSQYSSETLVNIWWSFATHFFEDKAACCENSLKYIPLRKSSTFCLFLKASTALGKLCLQFQLNWCSMQTDRYKTHVVSSDDELYMMLNKFFFKRAPDFSLKLNVVGVNQNLSEHHFDVYVKDVSKSSLARDNISNVGL